MRCALLLGMLALAHVGTAETSNCGRIVCYTTNWSQYRPGSGKFFPENVDPSLCTHVIYAFAKIQGNHLAAYEWNDDDTDWSVGLFTRLNSMKQRYPHVKTLLAVGGWNMGSDDFTRIVQSPSSRRDFITHSITFLRDRNFDGLDMDWEYPANRGSPPEDREYFTAFLRELRQEYENEARRTGRPRLLLTAAVAAGKSTIDTAYDIPAVSQELDFINLMTYDLHGAWETYTGHNSPLYARSDETGDDRTLNLDFAAQYWVQKGAPREKLTLGLGLYGRSFTLASASGHGVGAPAPRGGVAGTYTRESGFLSYYEICEMKKAGGTEEFIDEQRVPYAYNRDQWVGFDNTQSLREKVRYAKHQRFGGVMVWALPLDDFTGLHCGQGKYPLMNAIADECQHDTGVLHTQAPAQTTVHPPSATTPPLWQTTTAYKPPPEIHGDLLDCQHLADGFYPSGRSCTEYFICVGGTTYSMQCGVGLVYNANSHFCDWPHNYQCPLTSGTIVTMSSTSPAPATTVTYPREETHTTSHHTTESPETRIVTDLTTFCHGLTDGVHADPADPFHFIQCSNGNAYRMSCAPGSIFNEAILSCETAHGHPSVTALPGGSFDLDTYCQHLTDGVHADPTDCTHFIECSNGYGYRLACAPGSVFNPAITSCDNANHVPSCQTTVPRSAGTQTTVSAIISLRSFCFGKLDGAHADPDRCGYFIECSNGYGLRMACAQGTVFNPAISTCDNPSRVPSCNLNSG